MTIYSIFIYCPRPAGFLEKSNTTAERAYTSAAAYLR